MKVLAQCLLDAQVYPCRVNSRTIGKDVCGRVSSDTMTRLTECSQCSPPWGRPGDNTSVSVETDEPLGFIETEDSSEDSGVNIPPPPEEEDESAPEANESLEDEDSDNPIPPSILDDATWEKIAVADIDPDPKQPREDFDPGDLEDLRRNYKANNQVEPISVRKIGKRFMLINGERRWLTCKALGITHLWALVFTNPDIDYYKIAVIKNLAKSDHNPREYSHIAARLITEMEQVKENNKPLKIGVIKKRVAVILCMSAQTLDGYLSFNNLHPDIQKQITLRSRDGSTAVSSGLAKELAKIPNQEEQLRVLAEIREREMSVFRAKQLISMKREGSGKKSSRGRAPSDVYAILFNSLRIIEERIRIILDMGPVVIIKAFFTREEKDRKKIIKKFEWLLSKIDKIIKTIFNEGSIKNEVKNSVKELYADDNEMDVNAENEGEE